MSGLWLAFKLWGGLPRIGAALAKAARYLLAHPATLAAIVLAVLWRVEAHQHATAARGLAHCQAAAKAAEEAHDKAEIKYKKDATNAEKIHTVLAADGPVLVAAYASTRRVRTDRGDAPAKDNSTAIPQDAPAVPAVEVPESVLNTCDADYTYARAAYEWANSITTEEP